MNTLFLFSSVKPYVWVALNFTVLNYEFTIEFTNLTILQAVIYPARRANYTFPVAFKIDIPLRIIYSNELSNLLPVEQRFASTINLYATASFLMII